MNPQQIGRPSYWRIFWGLCFVAMLGFIPVRSSKRVRGAIVNPSRVELRCPEDSIVVAMEVSPGETVRSGESLFTLEALAWKGGARQEKIETEKVDKNIRVLGAKNVAKSAIPVRENIALDTSFFRAQLARMKAEQAVVDAHDGLLHMKSPLEGKFLRAGALSYSGSLVSSGTIMGYVEEPSAKELVILYPMREEAWIEESNKAEWRKPGSSWSPLNSDWDLRGTAPILGKALFEKSDDLKIAGLVEETIDDSKSFFGGSEVFAMKMVKLKGVGAFSEVGTFTPLELRLSSPWMPLYAYYQKKFSEAFRCISHIRESNVALSWYLRIYYFDFAVGSILFFISFLLMILYNETEIRRCFRQAHAFVVPKSPPSLSVLVPFFNEGITVLTTISSLVEQDFPIKEIILVDDGSTDSYFEQLRQTYRMTIAPDRVTRRCMSGLLVEGPVDSVWTFKAKDVQIYLVKKKNGGKSYALNAGINLATGTLICTIDADTLLEKDAIRYLAAAFVANPNLKAAAGSLRVVNNCTIRDGKVVEVLLPTGFFSKCQTAEYLTWHLMKTMNNVLDNFTVISGAFSCFRADAIRAIGGFSGRTITEDQDVCMELQVNSKSSGGRGAITYVPAAIAWTQVPYDFKGLLKQRMRWLGGTLQTLIKYRKVLFRPKFGWLGCYEYPRLWLSVFMMPFKVLMSFAGLPIQIFLFATSDIFRVFLFEYMVVFSFPFWILSYGFWYAYTLVYLDSKYHRTFASRLTYLHLLLYSIFVSPIYTAVARVFELAGYYSAIFGKLQWNKLDRLVLKSSPVKGAKA